jgi:hypothetical protein
MTQAIPRLASRDWPLIAQSGGNNNLQAARVLGTEAERGLRIGRNRYVNRFSGVLSKSILLLT